MIGGEVMGFDTDIADGVFLCQLPGLHGKAHAFPLVMLKDTELTTGNQQ